MSIFKKISKISNSWRYLIFVVLLYIVFLIFDYEIFVKSLVYCSAMVSEILQAFLVVFVLMVLSDYFITQNFISKYLIKNEIVKWSGVIIGGIISSGPIYMWYPLLGDLRKKVLDNGMLACFLYNRAIKIPLVPIALIFFSWSYLLVLGLVMIIISIFQGIIINYLTKERR